MEISSMPNAAAAYASRQAPVKENVADQVARQQKEEVTRPEAKVETAPKPAQESQEKRAKPEGMGEKLDMLV